jgi:hypothetical protein
MSEDYVGGRTESGLRSHQNVIMTDVDRVTKEKEELQKEDLPLAKAAGFLLEECRMVLPGIQALFGFQLITVFNSGFFELLSSAERALHLFALSLTAISIAFVMAPAAFHRQTGAEKVTKRFIHLASRLVLWGMIPLLIALCVDFYLIARIIAGGLIAFPLAVAVGGLFIALWFVLPRMNNKPEAPARVVAEQARPFAARK